MRVVKLDAIPSTNDFLKEMSRDQPISNFTVVTAEAQTNGKGQRGTSWSSEKGKNLTISIYVNETAHFSHGIFSMNVAVAMAIFSTIKKYGIPNSTVKWPNDIMADNKKLGGILIENLLRSDGTFSSIIGIGLNINQTDFTALPSATSLANQMKITVDKEEILNSLLTELQWSLSAEADQHKIWEDYRTNLFRLNVESTFELPNGQLFIGKIHNVNYLGQLVVLVNGKPETFSLKEVKLLY